ncbi:MAG: ATP-dependent ligase [Aeromicrobium sp.]|nr:ATP-dependent ligase [Aeromicrobium sp.]
MLPFPQDPMLAKTVDGLPHPGALTGGCAYEPKFDGYRALLFVDDHGCRVQSRRGHDITAAFRDVADSAAEQLPSGVILDGELVVWGDGALDFRELQSRLARRGKQRPGQRPASFVAFDVLCVSDTDVRAKSLRTRRALLEAVCDLVAAPLQISPQTHDTVLARDWLDEYARSDVGIEGLVVKGLGSPYANGARGWLKYRIRNTVEAVVGAVTGPLEAPDSLVLGLPDGAGALQPVGTTTEMSPHQRREVAELLEPAEPTHAWPPDLAVGRWGSQDKSQARPVRPTLVVEVSVDSAFEGGRWRHPTKLVRVRSDLSPSEVAAPRHEVDG